MPPHFCPVLSAAAAAHQALGLKPKAAPSTFSQPSLERHEVERLLKGAGDQDQPAGGNSGDADRMQGLGFSSKCVLMGIAWWGAFKRHACMYDCCQRNVLHLLGVRDSAAQQLLVALHVCGERATPLLLCGAVHCLLSAPAGLLLPCVRRCMKCCQGLPCLVAGRRVVQAAASC